MVFPKKIYNVIHKACGRFLWAVPFVAGQLFSLFTCVVREEQLECLLLCSAEDGKSYTFGMQLLSKFETPVIALSFTVTTNRIYFTLELSNIDVLFLLLL